MRTGERSSIDNLKLAIAHANHYDITRFHALSKDHYNATDDSNFAHATANRGP